VVYSVLTQRQYIVNNTRVKAEYSTLLNIK